MLHEGEAKAGTPPCLILAHPDPGYQMAIARGFRRLGWDVYLAQWPGGPPVSLRHAGGRRGDPGRRTPRGERLAHLRQADGEQPLVKVILVSRAPSPFGQSLAAFVGASALVNQADSLAPLVEELSAPAMPAAG